jgi:hypothetical protein
VHAFLTALFLVNGYWIAILVNLPLVAWNAKKYVLPALDSALTMAGSSTTSICWTPLKYSGSLTCTRRYRMAHSAIPCADDVAGVLH